MIPISPRKEGLPNGKGITVAACPVLSSGRFRWLDGAASSKLKTLTAHELRILLWSGNLKALDVPPQCRAL
jgi:hypothetical protein